MSTNEELIRYVIHCTEHSKKSARLDRLARSIQVDELTRLVELARRDECEMCARVAEAYIVESIGGEIAAAIRARGNE